MAKQRRDWRGFGEWLQRERDARGWSQDTAVEELRKLTGNKVTRNWLSQLENGSTPSDDLMRAFERLYGDFRPADTPMTGDLGALVAAINRQADAILELARVSRQDVATLTQRVDQTSAAVGRLLEAAAQGAVLGAEEAVEWGRREGYVPGPAEPHETPVAENARAGGRRDPGPDQGSGA